MVTPATDTCRCETHRRRGRAESTDPTNESAVDVEFASERVEHRDRLREAAVEAGSQLVR